jgi:hypothetical protein
VLESSSPGPDASRPRRKKVSFSTIRRSTFPANRSHEPFRVGILPGRSGRRQYLDAVKIANEVAGNRAPRKGLKNLPRGPFGRGMIRDVEVDAPSPVVGRNHKNEEDPKAYRWHGDDK